LKYGSQESVSPGVRAAGPGQVQAFLPAAIHSSMNEACMMLRCNISSVSPFLGRFPPYELRGRMTAPFFCRETIAGLSACSGRRLQAIGLAPIGGGYWGRLTSATSIPRRVTRMLNRSGLAAKRSCARSCASAGSTASTVSAIKSVLRPF
jgi:hypothetical protein